MEGLTYEFLDHGRIEFTLPDNTKWLFRRLSIKDAGPLIPIPVPQAAVGTEATEETRPMFLRQRIQENIDVSTQVVIATSIKPKIVSDDVPELTEAQAYLSELGKFGSEMAQVILDSSGFGGKLIGPFCGNRQRGTGGHRSKTVRGTAASGDEAQTERVPS